jgi:hypothetical protein
VKPVFGAVAVATLTVSTATYLWSLTMRGGIAAGLGEWLLAVAGLVASIGTAIIGWYRGEGFLAQAAACGALFTLVYVMLNS